MAATDDYGRDGKLSHHLSLSYMWYIILRALNLHATDENNISYQFRVDFLPNIA